MFSLSLPLAQGMPWLFALALLPAALLRGFWWPARIAGGLGLVLVLGAWLQAALDGQDNDRLGLAMLGLVGLLAWVIVEYSWRYLEGEPGQRRYVLALLVTLAAVATVVTSNDLVLLVGAWILSSLSLHQLLTFYRDRPQALVVAHKTGSGLTFLMTVPAILSLIGITAGTIETRLSTPGL